MHVNRYENFKGRVDYAARVIAKGTRNTTRTFDSCFENHDGDAVVAALARRAEKNPKLAANLTIYLTPETIATCREKYYGQDLTEVARRLREEGQIAFEAWLKAHRESPAA